MSPSILKRLSFFIAFGILFIYIFDKNLWHYYNTVNQI